MNWKQEEQIGKLIAVIALTLPVGIFILTLPENIQPVAAMGLIFLVIYLVAQAVKE